MKKRDKNTHAGFAIPENYFKTFEERLDASMFKEKSQRNKGFTVPEDYFESVEDAILKRVQFAQVPKKSKKPIFYRFAAIAAVIAIAVSVVNYQSDTTIDFDDLKMVSIESYFEDNYLDLDDEDLNALLEDGTDFSLNINEDALFEYLDNRIEDPTLLIE